MNKTFHIVLFFALIYIVGCSEKDDLPTIYHVHYDIEGLCFNDTTLDYDFNGDQRMDFSLELEISIDTIVYPGVNDYFIDVNYIYSFFEEVGSFSEMFGDQEKRWEVGDLVTESNSQSWSSAKWGGESCSTTNNEYFNAHIDSLKNTDIYWAFYLKSEGKKHYGWFRLRCFLIEEFAINLIPEEAILVGQRD